MPASGAGSASGTAPPEKGSGSPTSTSSSGFAPEDFEESVEKELLLCEVCGEVIAPVDQIRWLVRRLGPLAFANPTLMLVAGRALEIVDEPVRTEGLDVHRGHRVTIQCPKCRRKTAWAA